MENWKEKILQSDAGLARPELAESLIEATEKNGAEVLELSPLVGSPSQASRSPVSEGNNGAEGFEGIGKSVREEVLKLAPILKELVRKDIREAEEKIDE